MSNWTGSMYVVTAHQYVVEAESYDEARDKIVSLFEEGVEADDTIDVDCYPENIREGDEDMERWCVAESRFAALLHWERMFRNLFVDDEHADFIADTLTRAREKLKGDMP